MRSNNADFESFTILDALEPSSPSMTAATDDDSSHRLFDDVLHFSDAHTADHDIHYLVRLRAAHPTKIVTTVPLYSINLRAFAAATGRASYVRDTTTDNFSSWRGFNPVTPGTRQSSLAESVNFAKYRYFWDGEEFIVFLVGARMQYILAEARPGEDRVGGPSLRTDALIRAAGEYMLENVIWVFDGGWRADKALYEQVRKADWGKVILDEGMKQDLVMVAEKFFSSKQVYEDLGVPWRRGLLFHGPPGNGKTISIKALMHTLMTREEPIPSLYVKAAPNTYTIGMVFAQARRLAPCMLVLEDIESIVNSNTRSYFFNQLDGLEDNSGLFVVASTNFLDRLDPGLTKRPSRFDRKYLFPLPNLHERELYARFWRSKVKGRNEVEFPNILCPAMARITPGFSFAFMQEAFVATLLALAQGEDAVTVSSASKDDEGHDDKEDDDDEDLDKYVLWRVFRKQVKILRDQIDTTDTAPDATMPTPADRSSNIRHRVEQKMQGTVTRRSAEDNPSSFPTSFGHADAYANQPKAGVDLPNNAALMSEPSKASRSGSKRADNTEESTADKIVGEAETEKDYLPTLRPKQAFINSAAFMLQ